MRHLSGLWVLLILVGSGCDTIADDEPPRVLPFVTIDEAAAFVVREAGTAIIRDEAEWRRLWETYWSIRDGTGARTPPPAVNFNRRMVIAVFWGEGPSGCSNNVEAIASIIRRSGDIIVRVNPLPNLGPCTALVYPIQAVHVERYDLPVHFEGAPTNR